MQVRIKRDKLNGNRFQAQFRPTAKDPWGDIGEAQNTYAEAERKLAEFQMRHSPNNARGLYGLEAE